jgi:GNAT superfamily N-acetyltransferase
MNKDPDITLRPYRPADRAEIRRICADTGWLGKPIDPIFSDRELFADSLTNYYLDHEPDTCWVAVKDGHLIAYCFGCVRPDQISRLNRKIQLKVGLRGVLKILTFRYDWKDLKFIWWILAKADNEEPTSVEGAAHMHWNMTPAARGLWISRAFLANFIELAKKKGLTKMFGHMTVPTGKRSTAIFERFGWKEIDRREVTKFKEHESGPIYSITLYREWDPDADVGMASGLDREQLKETDKS